MMPHAGGEYVFLREAYGPGAGFLFGWALLLVIQTGSIAAVAVAFANFLGVLVPAISGSRYLVAPLAFGRYAVSLSTQQLTAVALILLLTLVNTRGLGVGKLVQNVFTVTKTAALIGLIAVGLTVGVNHGAAAFTSAWWDPWANGWSPQRAQPGFPRVGGFALAMLLGRAMVGPLFAQSSWNNVTFTAGEVREPGRNLPRALLAGCSLVVVLYVLANLAYVMMLSLAEIQTAPQNRVAAVAMQAVFGPVGTVLMASAIVISTFGCNNGLILAGARVSYAMARDGLFFRRIGTVNSRQVPAIALGMQGTWAAGLTLFRTVTRDPRTEAPTFGNVYTQLLEYIVSADLVFYALMVGAVMVMRRKRPDAPRPYRAAAYPLAPLVYIVLALLLVVDLAYLAPATSGVGYALVLTGVPVYLVWRRMGRGLHPAGRSEE